MSSGVEYCAIDSDGGIVGDWNCDSAAHEFLRLCGAQDVQTLVRYQRKPAVIPSSRELDRLLDETTAFLSHIADDEETRHGIAAAARTLARRVQAANEISVVGGISLLERLPALRAARDAFHRFARARIDDDVIADVVCLAVDFRLSEHQQTVSRAESIMQNTRTYISNNQHTKLHYSDYWFFVMRSERLSEHTITETAQ